MLQAAYGDNHAACVCGICLLLISISEPINTYSLQEEYYVPRGHFSVVLFNYVQSVINNNFGSRDGEVS